MARPIHYPPGTPLGGGKTVVQLLHAAGLRAVYKIRDADGRLLALKAFHHISPCDGAAQTDGHGHDLNEAGKHQTPTKPPPPTKDQKRPPCEPKYEVEMEGGCWQSAPSKTCDNGFTMDGKCYVPVLPDSGPPVADP